MENPLRRIRLKLGLSRADFAALLGLTYSQVNTAENGYGPSIPEAWRDRLEARGINYEQLAKDYAMWLADRSARVVAKIAAAGGAA